MLTVFFASSFTTALQRVYLRAWRRPPGGKVGEYARGPAWVLVVLASMAVLGGLRAVLGDGPQVTLFILISLVVASALWCFTAWFMLMGQVRWRVLVPTGVVTALAMGVYGLSAAVWMSSVVTRNEDQFGFFGVALALVTWFSGAAICVLIGACAGAVFAEDSGRVGAFIRGRGVIATGRGGSTIAPRSRGRTRAARTRSDPPRTRWVRSSAANIAAKRRNTRRHERASERRCSAREQAQRHVTTAANTFRDRLLVRSP